MMQQQPLSDLPETIKTAWQSPSNIALVKYWGKHGTQLPNNTSLSFTLDNCHTRTHLQANRKQGSGYSFEVVLDGKPAVDFEPKIATFFDRIKPYIGFLEDYHFTIATSNSFPHSSGIASSASGMSALALCLLSLERKMSEAPLSQTDFNRKASFLARLGSGSACRSIEGPLVLWGAHPEVEGSSDEFGLRPDIDTHPDFKDFQDYILLVDKGEKQVSSSVGHGLMIDHPYAAQRFKTANDNVPRIIDALRTGDMERFIAIVESEALQLHAMMMTSHPYFILMKPNTLEIINRIWAYRRETGLPVCFTLDAGANVHLLFPRAISQKVETFIKEQLQALCVDGSFIADHTGLGAREI